MYKVTATYKQTTLSYTTDCFAKAMRKLGEYRKLGYTDCEIK